MIHATAKELRLEAKRLLDAVARGEEVLITYRGRARARLVPLSSERSAPTTHRKALFGLWRGREELEDVQAHVDELRRSRQ